MEQKPLESAFLRIRIQGPFYFHQFTNGICNSDDHGRERKDEIEVRHAWVRVFGDIELEVYSRMLEMCGSQKRTGLVILSHTRPLQKAVLVYGILGPW